MKFDIENDIFEKKTSTACQKIENISRIRASSEKNLTKKFSKI